MLPQGSKYLIILCFPNPRAPSYLNRGLLGYVTIRYKEPRTHELGNWSPRETLYCKCNYQNPMCRMSASLDLNFYWMNVRDPLYFLGYGIPYSYV